MTKSSPHPLVEVLQDVPLKPYTTFKIGGPARLFAAVTTPQQAREALRLARSHSLPVFVLGGGSNILVSDCGLDGFVLHPAHTGVDLLSDETGRPAAATPSVRLRVSAGEPWDRVVGYAVDQGWWGVENLSHIPGQSGAALVQNIGAYGQQLSDVFEQAEVLRLSGGDRVVLAAAECDLSYRRSIFNSTRRGEFLIWSVTLRLSAAPRPQLGYRDVQAYFVERGDHQPTQPEIRQAIIRIRDSKFPYPREERGGNAGSFFKNPTLSAEAWLSLETRVGARFGEAGRSRLAELRRRTDPRDSIPEP
jgi:UDP-N-acetylmuramate dehydrogenase